MATITRLASTLTARYFPSNTLTDSFYMDGRLFGKRETRLADITIDKEDRGFFFSVFSHAAIPGYEPGTMPPYESTLRATCNEVKYGRKEIDGIIEGFLSTAVDVTGKMRLSDVGEHNPYFAGYIVRDGEAFAVTIGTGLAFLYRDDTLFPLTDAGISMEPIDTNGNKVSDFYYYCSSKTANALWSNFFSLTPDDCIILCNKEVYDALGQREILRILDEAEDQCDAAGTVITQASARMPNVPMQFAISFCEAVTSDEKRGLFGFKKKQKEPENENMDYVSSFDSGIVGAAAEAVAGSAVATGTAAAGTAGVMFGDMAGAAAKTAAEPVIPAPQAPSMTGFEFLDNSIPKAPEKEITAEDLMKSAMEELKTSETERTKSSISDFNPFAEETVTPAAPVAPSEEKPSEDIFIPVTPETNEDLEKTKPVNAIDSSFIQKISGNADNGNSIIAAALKQYADEHKEEVPSQPQPQPEVEKEIPITSSTIELVANDKSDKPQADDASAADAPFDPYSVGSADEMKNAAPLVFGDFVMPSASENNGAVEEGTASEIPVPEFEIKPDIDPSNPPMAEDENIIAPDFKMDTPKVEVKEEDKLQVDFPKASEEPQKVEEKPADSFVLPFENNVETIPEAEVKQPEAEDIPDMPLYNSDTFNTPTHTVNSDQPITSDPGKTYAVGGYQENEDMAQPEVPYTAFGQEGGQYEAAPQNIPYPYEEPQQPDSQPADTSAYYGYAEAPETAQSYEQYQGVDNMNNENPNAAGQTAADNDDWIAGILGYNEADNPTYTGEPQMPQGAPASVYAGTAPKKTQNAARPGGQRPQSQRPQASGNGGNGKSKFPKLSKTGMYFIAFVIFLLICLIVVISLIAKSCSKDDTVESIADVAVTDVTEVTAAPTVVETTSAPSQYDPIGVFVFSDNIGYRTMWDVVNKVYGIGDDTDVDSMISNILAYNGYDSTYSPMSGDTINLPCIDIVNGNLPATTGGTTTADTTTETTSGDVISGDISVSETTTASETAASEQ